MEASEAVRWVLGCSVGDINWRNAVARLTDEELRSCLAREDRKTARKRLFAEARRRGLDLAEVGSGGGPA